MSLLNSLLSKASQLVGNKGSAIATKAVNKATGQTKTQSYTYASLPTTLDEFKALQGADHKDSYAVAALTVIALCVYENNPTAAFEMLNYLKGPVPLSNLEKSNISDRFKMAKYVARSFIEGATPANDYTPSVPYKINVARNPYSDQEVGYMTHYLTSGGADSPRQVRLRQKASTQEWFLESQYLLGDIRTPNSANPFA